MPGYSHEKFLVVAVDGGAASGKSSLARTLAERFRFLHVDTGGHYRAVTLALIKAGIGPDDQVATAALEKISLGTHVDGSAARILLEGETPDNTELRGEEVNRNVSRFAALPSVRKFLFNYQRGLAQVAQRHGFAGLVMEGRDIGSVIFPNADLRLFLTADAAVRAGRRAAEGQTDAVAERDRLDSSRAAAPLTCPPGAVVIDSTGMTLEEVAKHAAVLIEASRRRIENT